MKIDSLIIIIKKKTKTTEIKGEVVLKEQKRNNLAR